MTVTDRDGLPVPVNRPASTSVWGESAEIGVLTSPSPLSELEQLVDPAATSRTE
jgi:hypothetical protein